MDETIFIRELKFEDWYNGLSECLNELGPIDELTTEEFAHIMWKRSLHTTTFVAVLNKRIIGTGSIMVEEKYFHNGGIVCHVEDVVVCKHMQGKGIGRKIVNRLIEHSKIYNPYKIILSCSDYNLPFYEKLGFYRKNNEMRVDCLTDPVG